MLQADSSGTRSNKQIHMCTHTHTPPNTHTWERPEDAEKEKKLGYRERERERELTDTRSKKEIEKMKDFSSHADLERLNSPHTVTNVCVCLCVSV